MPSNLDFFYANCPPYPAGWIDLDSEPFERRSDDVVILERFRDYMTVVRNRKLRFEGPDRETGELVNLTIPSSEMSRYTPSGRAKIRRKLSKRLDRQHKSGVLLTLTVDPKKYSKREAWESIWREYAAFRRRLWKVLRRAGWKHSPLYVAALEQHKSGYPHLHVAYPGLRFLARTEVINRAWHMGSTHIVGGRRRGGRGVSVSALAYVLKYVRKLAGWSEEGLAHLWHARARLYNISPRLYQTAKKQPCPGWEMTRIEYRDEGFKARAHLVASIRVMRKRPYCHKRRKEVPHDKTIVLQELCDWFDSRRAMMMVP